MNRDNVNKYLYFVRERENIRERRAAGLPRPWTRDPILAKYKFTNIRREDDYTTQWIDKHVMKAYAHTSLFQQAKIIFAARMFNRVSTIEVLLKHWPRYTVNPCIERLRLLISNMRRDAKAAYCTGAYIILGKPGMPKLEGVLNVIHDATYDLYHLTQVSNLTCAEAHQRLVAIPYIADFMAAQFIADYKNTDILKDAPDKHSFSVPGPGSTRGLNWLMDRESEKPFKGAGWDVSIRELQLIVKKELNIDLDAQNIQNTLCELSKYVRGFSRNTFKPRIR